MLCGSRGCLFGGCCGCGASGGAMGRNVRVLGGVDVHCVLTYLPRIASGCVALVRVYARAT